MKVEYLMEHVFTQVVCCHLMVIAACSNGWFVTGIATVKVQCKPLTLTLAIGYNWRGNQS